MPKYSYIVINQENKQLNGTIGAPTETEARQELNELGFSVISIQEIHEDVVGEVNEGLMIFEFAAIDKSKKRVLGTIQAPDRYQAYKRLTLEYAFEVEYIVDKNLSEEEKTKERRQGVYELQDRLHEEEILAQKKETSDEKDLKEFAQKQEVLKAQIEFVLHKVKEMLDLYEQQMKPETKEKIKYYVNKILRIKTSTNLDYVRKTAEELLNYLQKEEIFLNVEAQTKERTQMIIEAKSMMMQLRKGKSKKSMSFTASLYKWRQLHINENLNPSIGEKFINFFISLIIGEQEEDKEIITLREELARMNDQIKQYIRLYFSAPNNDFKIETREGLKRLWKQRKNIKQELKKARSQKSLERKNTSEKTMIEKITEETCSLSGWVLVFYLIYYFLSNYLVSKDFSGIFSFPYLSEIFSISTSSLLKYFLPTLFLVHAALSLKINFFRRNEVATLIITPLFLLGSLMIYFNF